MSSYVVPITFISVPLRIGRTHPFLFHFFEIKVITTELVRRVTCTIEDSLELELPSQDANLKHLRMLAHTNK